MKAKFMKFINQLSRDEMTFITGGVSRAEYCSTLCDIMRSCYNRGDLECVENGGQASSKHCGGSC